MRRFRDSLHHKGLKKLRSVLRYRLWTPGWTLALWVSLGDLSLIMSMDDAEARGLFPGRRVKGGLVLLMTGLSSHTVS